MNGMAHFSGPNEGLRELALFAGAGGGILGGHLLGWRTVCAVEWEPYPAAVLAQRQNDGILAPFPIWDDVRTFDGRPWRGIVDVVSGGFPCQDISAAGKGEGITGERSGLWREFARIIREVGPRFVFVENSPILTVRGIGVVLGELASMGYNAKWAVYGSHDAGGAILGDRIWILATTDKDYGLANGSLQTRTHQEKHVRSRDSWPSIQDADRTWLLSNSFAVPQDYEMADWVDEFAAIGNGQDPGLARLAWEVLNDPLP